MSITTVTMFRVICNGCGRSAQDDGEFWAWADADQAVHEATSSEWVDRGDGTHWCTRCTVCDEDGMVPTPEALAAAAENERAALTGNLGGDPDRDPDAVLADDHV